MPVYLCCPGTNAEDPWRHGVQVFAAPFDLPTSTVERSGSSHARLMDLTTAASPATETGTADESIPLNLTTITIIHSNTEQQPQPLPSSPSEHNNQGEDEEGEENSNTNTNNNNSNSNVLTGPEELARYQTRALFPAGSSGTGGSVNRSGGGGGGGHGDGPDRRPLTWMQQQQQRQRAARTTANSATATTVMTTMIPIRRVRHAEIVLVDDVCAYAGRYWLRLRWPGHKGGFAGYIAMGLVGSSEDPNRTTSTTTTTTTQNPDGTTTFAGVSSAEKNVSSESHDDREDEDPAREETGSMPPSEPFEGGEVRSMVCRRTGIAFQSTSVLKLLALYDDGIVPSSVLPTFPTEPVFCRICREGLHDDADEVQPAAAADEGADRDPSHQREPVDRRSSRRRNNNDYPNDDDEPIPADPTEQLTKGPVQPNPAYSPNTDALQNPMLAPCECAGSMAFVHYLCVEQWRCRSRHPEAANGLNCETCGTAYSLPPPSERPMQVPEQEDWLDAMPPHVMQALRQPHIWWQIGAAIVRRRWLRPIAPVLMSPVVALYCRARRLLKKRGVARRRWACSLCRRRARWKCVRCLRSYYCSRQCQNVSWHIIHKHVCYKPVRFWWSVVVYGALTLMLFPGIIRDPLMYDIGVCLIPASFVIMSILGGGVATVVKKATGVDLRGRLMELAVVVGTLWFSVMSWGLAKGFFGNTSACYGTVGSYSVTAEDVSSTYILRGLRALVLRPAKKIYLTWDRIFLNSWLRSALCTNRSSDIMNSEGRGCFEHLPKANADFCLIEAKGEKCAADLLLFFVLYATAGLVFAGSALWKHHERQRRRQGGRRQVVRGGPPHFHQD